jgi:hypothetical protein
VKHSSTHMLIAMVVLFNLELEPDVTIAVLLSELRHQPKEFIIKGKEDHVHRLKKSLYRFKQPLRQWYERFDNFMIEQGNCRSNYDNCVYHTIFKWFFCYLLPYIDDILIAMKSMIRINILKTQLGSVFEKKDLGVTGGGGGKLGMEIHLDGKWENCTCHIKVH